MKDVVQIAGVLDRREADLLVESGADYLGFPLCLLDGREDLSETDARSIIESLPARAVAVCITYLADPRRIAELCERIGAGWVQLHGALRLEALVALKRERPELSVIKSLIVRGDNASALAAEVEDCSPYVDAFLTDTYDPATGRSGATGRTHDWSVSRRLVEISPRPVILAGGLNPGNVREAILQTTPAGVDAHSGLERPDGRKCPVRVREFLAESRAGFEMVAAGTPNR